MGDASVNGDLPQSATLNHIAGYPVVHDSIEAIKKNPYGQKSINITQSAFDKFVKPTLPYFETPASYAKPYAIKIDEYGNLFLDKVDEKVPVLKAETEEFKSTVVAYVHLPVEKVDEAYKWLLQTYSEEYKKCGGDGIVAGGKALITSSLVVTSEVLAWLSTYLAQKKGEAKDFAKEAEKKAKELAAQAEKRAKELATEAEKKAKEAEREATN